MTEPRAAEPGEDGAGAQRRGGAAAGGSAPAARPLGRRAFWLLLAAAVIAVAVFRVNAATRARGPLIADSTEYLMMARDLVDGYGLAVSPVRSGFFPLFLAVPLFVQRKLFGVEGAADPLGYQLVMTGFAALALAAAYRLGARLGGRRAGLAAVALLGVLPELTYWSSDYLTDVPAGACLAWALVLGAEGRPKRAGLALGAAVMLRYQSLISMAAILAIPLAGRRWKSFGATLLGFLPAFLLLGLIDAYVWGSPFQSLRAFVPAQLTTFLPRGLVEAILPGRLPSAAPAPAAAAASAAPALVRSWSWYLASAPALLHWPLLAGVLAYPLARHRFRERTTADAAAWVVLATLLVLSVQRYKEPRYVLAVAPLVAGLGGAGLTCLLAAGVRRAARRPLPRAVLGAVLALGIGAYEVRAAWRDQARRHFAPFGSILSAAEAIPRGERPCLVTAPPWILAREYPPRVVTYAAWRSGEISTLHLKTLAHFLAAAPADWPHLPGRGPLEAVDFFLVRPDAIDREPGLERWINERAEYAGYFLDPAENDFATLMLRTVPAAPAGRTGAGPAPFWDARDARARDGEALGAFAGSGALEGCRLELVGFEVERLGGGANAVRIDSRWRVPERPGVVLAALVEIQDEERRVLGRDTLQLVSDEPALEEGRRGGALRLSRYRSLVGAPATDRLHFLVSVIGALPEEQARELMRAEGPARMPDGRLRASARIE